MKITPIVLIEELTGKLNQQSGYYIRRSRTGRLYSCRCPDRSGHVKKPAEVANQQQFAAKYAGWNRKLSTS